MQTTVDLQTRLATVRSHYRVTPWIEARDDEAPLLRSWQRCRDAGMREHECVSFEPVSRMLLAELDERHRALVHGARPETERLARALRGTGCAVVVFNARGVVVDRLCHEAATPAPLLQASRKGINVAERCVGTTAPSIALTDGVPNLVGRSAHFFASLRPFFCVAAPIDSPGGERLGALDITAYDSVPAFDVFALVQDAATAIENSLFAATRDQLLVHFHPRAELVGTPLEGLLAVAQDGRICGANRMAARLLCLTRQQLVGRDFTGLFDRRLQALFSHPPTRHADQVEMQTHCGLMVQARFESGADRPAAGLGDAGFDHGLPARSAVLAGQTLADAPANGSLRAIERRTIEQTVSALGGNVSAAARQLGISRNTIYRRRQA